MPSPQREDFFAAVDRIEKRLERLERSVGHVEDERPLLLGSQWSAYDPAFKAPSYYRDPFGMVHVSGVVKGNGSYIGVLEDDCLPAPGTREIFSCYSNLGIVRVDVRVDGLISPVGFTAATLLSLSPISFRVA